MDPSWRINTEKGVSMLARNKHRLFIYRSDSKIYEEILQRKLPQLHIHSAGRPEEAFPYIEEAEILLSSKVIPDDLLKKARRLVWFASTSAGNESLVKNPFLPASVTLTKTTIYGEMMAEFVFAYLLYFIRGGSKHLGDQKKKIWDPVRPERLRGKVLAILGLGSVGKEIAKRGKQFGMRVIGVRRTPEPVEEVDQIFGPQDLDKMIPKADYLVSCRSLHTGDRSSPGRKRTGLVERRRCSLQYRKGNDDRRRGIDPGPQSEKDPGCPRCL